MALQPYGDGGQALALFQARLDPAEIEKRQIAVSLRPCILVGVRYIISPIELQ